MGEGFHSTFQIKRGMETGSYLIFGSKGDLHACICEIIENLAGKAGEKPIEPDPIDPFRWETSHETIQYKICNHSIPDADSAVIAMQRSSCECCNIEGRGGT